MKRSAIISIFCVLVATIASPARGAETPADSTASMMYLPLIFDTQNPSKPESITAPEVQLPTPGYDLDSHSQWLSDAQARQSHDAQVRYRAMLENPQLVAFNTQSLPEAPHDRILTSTPSEGLLSVAPPQVVEPTEAPPAPEVSMHDWLHTFVGSLHFTQAYISDNWYQGGTNNLNILADIKWDFNLNQDLHPNWLFNNTMAYKLGVTTAQADTIRDYMINEDNFLFTSQLGYKAVKNWYYSVMLQFKTQFFNNYKPNSNDLTASFLSPGELNLGLGMTYDYKSADGSRTFTLAIAPLSYNMKICRDIKKLNPVNFGIDADHHFKHSFGSNLEAKWMIKFNANITWQSRFYVFTDYSYVQGDWESTWDFAISRHLNTQIYTHLRYDRSHPRHDDWKYWQFKEILSFGITYRFATM
ncbi:MAG: DUF3078 domain-containing protein [Muribaculaceae bacterium]|nr:DUF3078 domain-containing protein [Muribaculaceae bacterium]